MDEEIGAARQVTAPRHPPLLSTRLRCWSDFPFDFGIQGAES
jgi:hypothetical protein